MRVLCDCCSEQPLIAFVIEVIILSDLNREHDTLFVCWILHPKLDFVQQDSPRQSKDDLNDHEFVFVCFSST